MADELISRLQEQHARQRIACEQMLTAAKAAGRTEVTKSERRAIDDLKELKSRIEYLTTQDERQHGISDNLRSRFSPSPQERRTPMTFKPGSDYHLTYRQLDNRGGPGGSSWIRDLMLTSIGQDETGECRRRLNQHAQEVSQDPLFLEARDLSRTDGQGGYAVPPAWLMNQYIELARPGRPFANIVKRQPLPGGTDSINIPKILSGTTVGIQTSDNAAVSNTDLTDTFINAPVRTISGQQSVAIQLIDQSPIAFDEVIFQDLTNAYATAVDIQVLDGNGSGGQVLGVDYTPGISTITPNALTIQGIYSALANAIQLVHTQRFLPPEVIVMHPRRWAWFQSLLDTTDRPLFLGNAYGPWNAAGILESVASQGAVGQIFGLPVVVDANISVTNGPYSPSGNEDIITVARVSDLVLWESGVRARVYPEPKAANLTVLLVLWGYLAFSAARYPQSIVQITGLSAPSF